MKFYTTERAEKKRRQGKPKRKNLNKYEKLFIEKYGVELYDKSRCFFPELRRNPSQWKGYLKYGEYFGDWIYACLVGEGDCNDG